MAITVVVHSLWVVRTKLEFEADENNLIITAIDACIDIRATSVPREAEI